jgi:hypothetical protein
VIAVSWLGMSALTSKKFATRTSSNQSHVLRGGIFAWPLPCEGLTFPTGGGASARCVVFMVTSALPSRGTASHAESSYARLRRVYTRERPAQTEEGTMAADVERVDVSNARTETVQGAPY